MAHPFSAVPTQFPVETEGGTYWANCAWDAFGVPFVLGADSRTVASCAGTGQEVELGVQAGRPLPVEGVVHFAVRPREFWQNIGFT
jgi:hypothetical protein